MVVEILTLDDGIMLTGLSVHELVKALNESAETDG
jgi:predicted amidophosphoribosyltransferase